MTKKRIVQSCKIEGFDGFEDKCLNVKQMHEILGILIDEGYGEYSLRFGYDSNYGSTCAMNKFDIKPDVIFFRE